MYIPKWAVFALAFVGAVFVGWMARMAVADVGAPPVAASPAGAAGAAPAQPETAAPAPHRVARPVAPAGRDRRPARKPPVASDRQRAHARPANAPSAAPAAPVYVPVYVPVYMPAPTEPSEAAESCTPPPAPNPGPPPAAPVAEQPAPPPAPDPEPPAAEPSSPPPAPDPEPSPAAPVAEQPSPPPARPEPAPHPVRTPPREEPRPEPHRPSRPDGDSTPPRAGERPPAEHPRPATPRPAVPRPAAPAAVEPTVTPTRSMTINANGNNIVIAADGAIVTVGDNPIVTGNTGDASASGVIGVDPENSTLNSGDSQDAVVPPSPAAPPDTPDAPDTPDVPDAPDTPDTPQDSTRAVRGRTPDADPPRGVTGPAPAAGANARPGRTSRAVAIAGMENHSVDVGGDDNVVTYDDSNVVLHRRGRVNGNTGDTDTSGLNVVDDVGSTIRSGDSGNSDEAPDDPPANPAATTRRGPPTNQRGGATRTSATVTDVNGTSSATATDSLVVGGDGIDDNGVTVRGGRNVVTYDDGNVAIGGAGDTNAQIGDSDTGGAVTIGTRRSRIRAGNSFLPARQQAGAETADPFDGDDPDVSSD